MSKEMTNEQLGDQVKAAVKDAGVTGILALAEHADLSNPRTSKVWHGFKGAKIGDYITVMHSLGYRLEFVKRGA